MPLSGHDYVDADDAESTQKFEKHVIIASLKSDTMGKLINRISGSCLDIKFTKLGFENACQQAFSKPCLVI